MGLRSSGADIHDRRRLPDGAPPEVLVALQQRIAERVGLGHALGRIERDVVDPSPLDSAQRNALRLFAVKQLSGRTVG